MKEKVAERIRIARISKGLTQQNLADELGITVAAYSNIERGITDVTVTRVFQIAQILKLDPTRLFLEPKLKGSGDSNHSSDLVQQVFMLIQQVQQLNNRIDQLDMEIKKIKKS